MKRNLYFTIIVLTLLLVSCSQPAATPTPTFKAELGSVDEEVDQQIQVLIEGGDIPSLSVGIVGRGHPVSFGGDCSQ